MKKIIYSVLLFGLVSLLFSCAGGTGRVSGGVGIYHHYPGFYNPWWGYGRDRIIVVPPDRGGGYPEPEQPIEPTIPIPQPEMPDMGMSDMSMPDMGMPDMGMPDMDVGGFDF